MSGPPEPKQNVALPTGPVPVNSVRGVSAARRTANVVVGKSSRARPNKGQLGWGNMSPEILRRILGYASSVTSLPNVIPSNERNASLIAAIAQKNQLLSLRLVSSGWCKAVDSHPFWSAYLKAFRPDFNFDVAAQRASTTSFQLTRKATTAVCIPCKLSNPASTNRSAGKYITWTTYAGPVPTCEGHYQRFCAHCLRLNGDPNSPHLNLAFCDPDDRDETGRKRGRHILVCRFCRERAYELPLRREIIECARGGVIAGQFAPFSHTPSAADYIQFGRGLADSAAKRALEEMFLCFNTRWAELWGHMLQFQRILRTLRTTCFSRQRFVITSAEQDAFQRSADLIWGVDVDAEDTDPDYWLRKFRQDVEIGNYGEDEWRHDYEAITLPVGETTLWPMLREKLIRVCIQRWALHRVQIGFWVMPSDEVDQLVTGVPRHHDIAIIATNARHPSYAPDEELSQEQLERAKINYRVDPSQGVFLPPHRLLSMMNEEFTELLVNRLESPFNEIVDWQKLRFPDWEAAEESCAHTSVPQLLQWLSLPESWVSRGLTSVELSRRPTQNPPSEAGGETVVSSSGSGGSPRIEVVEEQDGHHDFVVRDGWVPSDEGLDIDDRDSFLDDDDVASAAAEDDLDDADDAALATNSALGKRKNSDELRDLGDRPSRPRLGSGQTSQSSEASTVTTLVTPNDSPGLLMADIRSPENDDEADAAEAQNSTPVAASITGANAATPGQSPTLRKRKTPEAEGDGQPLQRVSDGTEPQSPRGGDKRACEDGHCDKKPAAQAAEPDLKRGKSLVGDKHIVEPPNTSSPASATLPGVSTPSSEYQEHHMSDSDSTLSSEDYDDGEVTPWVPGPSSKLGPAVEELIRHSWYRAYEPLRECRCTICVRAREEDTNRILMLSAFGVEAGLRLA